MCQCNFQEYNKWYKEKLWTEFDSVSQATWVKMSVVGDTVVGLQRSEGLTLLSLAWTSGCYSGKKFPLLLQKQIVVFHFNKFFSVFDISLKKILFLLICLHSTACRQWSVSIWCSIIITFLFMWLPDIDIHILLLYFPCGSFIKGHVYFSVKPLCKTVKYTKLVIN